MLTPPTRNEPPVEVRPAFGRFHGVSAQCVLTQKRKAAKMPNPKNELMDERIDEERLLPYPSIH